MRISISDTGIDALLVYIPPLGVANRSHASGLMRRQNQKAQSFVDQCGHYKIVARGFGQPQRFGIAHETIAKIGNAPANLSTSIAFIAEGQDRVAISLSDRVAMTTALVPALTIGVDDARVSVRMISCQPGQQRRAKVETDPGVVVDD